MHSYKFINKINAGNFGTVFKAIDDNNNIYAIKKVILKYGHKERDILKKINKHENIIQFMDYYEIEDKSYIVEEYCERGDLQEYINKHKLNEEKVSIIIKQILTALTYCRSLNIMMCDVKPANVLIDTNYKLCDFGSSQICEEPCTGLTRIVGTPLYLAPEILYRNYGYLADIYSLGVMTYYLITKTYPYLVNSNAVSEEVMKAITDHDIYIDSKILSHDAYDFIIKCMEFDKYSRMNYNDALLHPFINKQ